ncbi:MAG: hypothetical protein EON54_01545 [Alcaligenaceae bacterium]|nr:MAG: hypothetical protein EON54_01545 [Alcaligenaceae bacterium]
MNHADILKILYDLDPMRSGCAENLLLDEYETQAAEIDQLINDSAPIRTAVKQVFDRWFWEGCLESGGTTSRLDEITDRLSKVDRRFSQC